MRIRRLQYVAEKPENVATDIKHAESCREVWGACSIRKSRPCESASEAVGDYLWLLECKLRRFIVLLFLGAPSLSAFVFEALPKNCLFNLGAADLSPPCMQAIHIEMCAASK